jgi:bifunctional UDP-N-acetylglucosamine pyrophosphorylase/glucosamine-1-phosphate N-acetyltransferase
MSTSVVILAAGKGTRMKTGRAKVLHEAAGRTLLGWALEEAAAVDPDEIVVVVGHGSDQVAAAAPSGTKTVVQVPQLGTADAVRVGLEGLVGNPDTVLILPGDMPLVTAESLRTLLDTHNDTAAAGTVMTVQLTDPTGYGRVIRSGESVVGIVEHADATSDQRLIGEVNTSVYIFDTQLLSDAIAKISSDNSQGEYYLPDAIEILISQGHTISAVTVGEAEGIGVNTHGQLAQVAGVLRERINADLMDSGVSMLDPSRVYVDVGVSVAPGATLLPDTYLRGTTTVGTGAVVGPTVEAEDSTIGEGATVRYTVMSSSVIGANAIVGPFTYLRPGTELKEGSKAGAYVEIKESVVGKGSKVPHLSYIGNAEIGEGSNIGAATVTVNYDGEKKHKTKVGDRTRIGSDTMLIAPVTVGDDAYTGAGSVITNDVPDGALGIERSDQRIVEGYAEKRRKRAEEKAE